VWDVYDVDAQHFRVGAFIDTLTHDELTARVDYLYDGRNACRGEVRHVALRVWRDGVGEGDRSEAYGALALLRADCPGVLALEVADDLGWAGAGRADLVVEAHFAGEEEAAAFRRHPLVSDVEALLDQVTDPARTARIEHRVRSG
jgi:hypothetical protein